MSTLKTFLKSPADHRELITRCFTDILTSTTDSALITKFLVALHSTKLDRDPQVIAQAVEVLRRKALKWQLPEARTLDTHEDALNTLKDSQTTCVDIVGTGGDGQNTFNVSTTAGIVAAGVPGIRVIKHGNRASTSASGSADILKSYGCNLLLNPTDIPSISSSFLFLLAPIWNPSLANVALIRKQLKHPTIFNILGPLLNPAPIDARIIGVHSPELGSVFVESFSKLNPKGRCMIVCGEEGLDEISPAGKTTVWTYDAVDGVKKSSIHPDDFGLSTHSLDSVKSGTPAENAAVLTKLLAGEVEKGDPVLDYVLLNCAALLKVAGVVDTYVQGVALALESVKSGAAKLALDTFRDESTAVLERVRQG